MDPLTIIRDADAAREKLREKLRDVLRCPCCTMPLPYHYPDCSHDKRFISPSL